MNLEQALDWRYAVRAFSDDVVSDQTLHELLEHTRKSPSAYGLQPYKLLVIKDKALRARLVAESYGQEKVRDSSHLIIFAAETHTGDASVDRYFNNVMQTRGVSSGDIVGYSDFIKRSLADQRDDEKLAVAQQQAYIALGVFLTCAAMMHVDACPMTGFDVQGYNKALNLDEQGLTAVAIVAIGTRSDADQSARDAKVRRPFSDLIHFIS